MIRNQMEISWKKIEHAYEKGNQQVCDLLYLDYEIKGP